MEDRGRAGLWLAVAGVNGAIAVVGGAIGAHAAATDGRSLVSTGALYQLIHAAALLAVAMMMRTRGGRIVDWAGWAFLAGCLFFSGGLYTPAAGWHGAGAVAAAGGLAFTFCSALFAPPR